jgi:hypothetical protein
MGEHSEPKRVCRRNALALFGYAARLDLRPSGIRDKARESKQVDLSSGGCAHQQSAGISTFDSA